MLTFTIPSDAFLRICFGRFYRNTFKLFHHQWHIGKLWRKHAQKMFFESFPPNIKLHISQTHLKALVIVFKFELSFLTFAIILFSNHIHPND